MLSERKENSLPPGRRLKNKWGKLKGTEACVGDCQENPNQVEISQGRMGRKEKDRIVRPNSTQNSPDERGGRKDLEM